MVSLGTHLTVLAGPTVPLPLAGPLAGRLTGATVHESDSERSAFDLTFDAGRSGPGGPPVLPQRSLLASIL